MNPWIITLLATLLAALAPSQLPNLAKTLFKSIGAVNLHIIASWALYEAKRKAEGQGKLYSDVVAAAVASGAMPPPV